MIRMLLITALIMSAAFFSVATALATGQESHICFYAMDADRDGFVSWEEFSQAYGEDSAEMFAALDADGDGLLVHDEYHVDE